MENNSKFKHTINLLDKFLSIEEAEELENTYKKLILTRFPNIKKLKPSEYPLIRKQAMAGNSVADEKIKNHTFLLALDILIDFYISKDTGDYLFEDAVSETY